MKRFWPLVLALAVAWPALAQDDNVTLRVGLNNPFNPGRGQLTRFDYARLDAPGVLRLSVYTLDGQRVAQLVNAVVPANTPQSVTWDGRDDNGALVAPGVYFVLLEATGARRVRRVIVQR